jgi:hypothetical protein
VTLEASETVYPAVLLQAVVVNLGDKTDDGPLVERVSVAWFEIVSELLDRRHAISTRTEGRPQPVALAVRHYLIAMR